MSLYFWEWKPENINIYTSWSLKMLQICYFVLRNDILTITTISQFLFIICLRIIRCWKVLFVSMKRIIKCFDIYLFGQFLRSGSSWEALDTTSFILVETQWWCNGWPLTVALGILNKEYWPKSEWQDCLIWILCGA